MVIDINQANQAGDEDPMEVIVNLVHPHAQEAFLELNVLINAQNEELAIAAVNNQQQEGGQQGLLMDLNLLAEEEALMNLAGQEMAHIQVIHVDVMPEEIGVDDLMNEDEMIEVEQENHVNQIHPEQQVFLLGGMYAQPIAAVNLGQEMEAEQYEGPLLAIDNVLEGPWPVDQNVVGEQGNQA